MNTTEETVKITATCAETIEDTATDNKEQNDEDEDSMEEEVPEDDNKAESEVFISGSHDHATNTRDRRVNITIDGSEDSAEEGDSFNEHTLSYDSQGDVKETSERFHRDPSTRSGRPTTRPPTTLAVTSRTS